MIESFYHMQSSEQEVIMSVNWLSINMIEEVFSDFIEELIVSISSLKGALESKSWLCQSTGYWLCQSTGCWLFDMIQSKGSLQSWLKSCVDQLTVDSIDWYDLAFYSQLINKINSSINNLQCQINFTNVNVLMRLPFAKQCYVTSRLSKRYSVHTIW